jgi:hypothetical protein
VAAERRDVGLVARLVVALVASDDGLLRILVGEQLGDEQRRGGQADSLGGVACEADELLRRDAVRLVERHRQAELAVVPGDDRRPLAEAGVEHRLHAGRRLDLRQLRGHVGVARAVALVGDDLDAVLARDLDALAAHRLVEASRAGDQGELGELSLAQVGEDLLARHAVGVRRLEHPRPHRLDDADRAGERDERRPRLLGERDRGHRRPRRRAADDDVDLVLLEQPLGERARLLGVAAVVVDDELDPAPVDSAGAVQPLGEHLERLLLGIAEERGRTGDREEGADAKRLLGVRGARPEHACRRCRDEPQANEDADAFPGCHRCLPVGSRPPAAFKAAASRHVHSTRRTRW